MLSVKNTRCTRSRRVSRALVVLGTFIVAAVLTAPSSLADNRRLNNAVVANVFTIQRQAGCDSKIKVNPQLQLVAEGRSADLMASRTPERDRAFGGFRAQDRANVAGFRGAVAETVAIHPALAISGLELLNLWYHDPAYVAIIRDCRNTAIGVWSENRLDRTVVVAVYGQPS